MLNAFSSIKVVYYCFKSTYYRRYTQLPAPVPAPQEVSISPLLTCPLGRPPNRARPKGPQLVPGPRPAALMASWPFLTFVVLCLVGEEDGGGLGAEGGAELHSGGQRGRDTREQGGGRGRTRPRPGKRGEVTGLARRRDGHAQAVQAHCQLPHLSYLLKRRELSNLSGKTGSLSPSPKDEIHAP